jgi:siroheme synthase
VTVAPADTLALLNANCEIVISGVAAPAAAGAGAGSGLTSRVVAVNAAAVTHTTSDPVMFMTVRTSLDVDRFAIRTDRVSLPYGCT